MNKLKAKLRKQRGFTLVEMLIVIGIIGILIAVSIPAVSGVLERAKHATDAANERAAKAVIMLELVEGTKSYPDSGSADYKYDAKNGIIVADTVNISNYGKHKQHKYIRVKLTAADGTNPDKTEILWMVPDSGAALKEDSDCCGDHEDANHS